MNITKTCRKCGRETPYEELVKHKECTYGVDALCKDCHRKGMRQRYANSENRRRALQNMKDYYRRNAEKIKKYKRQWQIENWERLKEYHAQWRANPENAAYREKVRNNGEIWRNQNKEHQRQNVRKWQQANPERKRVSVRNRRARKRDVPGKHTAADMQDQYTLQNGLCYWCSESLNSSYHADHAIPLMRGVTNYPDNIVCACERCNCSKADRLPYIEWQPPNPLFPNKRPI